MKKHVQHHGKVRLVTVFLSILGLSFAIMNTGYSQMTVVGGTTVKVNNATSLSSTENLVMSSGGTLNVQGTLILKKNLVNQNPSPNSLGSGSIVLSGSVNQTVSGQNIIQDLTVNNAAGVSIAGNTQVNGALTLTNGLVSLGAYNLQLGTNASVSGSPSAGNMVVATGTGEMRKEFSGPGTFTFPVGAADTPPEFSPVTVTYNTGTFGSGNYTGVNLVDEQYPGTAESYLTTYWTVSQSGVTNFSANATFQYNTDDVVGAEEDIFCTRVLPGDWITYNAANTANHRISASGLSSFGTFTGNLGNGTTPPGIRSIQDRIIANGESSCADATQTLIIAGNGTYYTVQPGGSVNHIAGQKILYYPGTKVQSGGYLHGYISTTYCNPPNPIVAPVIAGNINEGVSKLLGNTLFKVYPNPTPGDFTLELKGDLPEGIAHIEIYGALGERIMTKDLELQRTQEFSLIDRPVGVYVIHVRSGQKTQTEKIIKK